jgi:adenosyl cobinamide kinase/adenosyl cobinamide phosphate guanylyltransferase
MSAEEVFGENEVDPSEMPGFYGWYSKSGSWQSSWQANRKKQHARQQQQQQWRRQQDAAAVEALLSQLDRETRGVIAQVLGQQLEHMSSLEVSCSC